MKKSKIIALTGITTGFATLLLVVGAYFPTFDLSALFLASVVCMLPLSKKAWGGAIISCFATAILTLLISGFRFQIVIPFVLFFGFHPIVNYLQIEKNWNKYVLFIIKDVWFVIALVILQLLSEVIMIDIEAIRKYLYPILIVGGALAFIVYDYFIFRFQKYIDFIIKRLKL